MRLLFYLIDLLGPTMHLPEENIRSITLLRETRWCPPISEQIPILFILKMLEKGLELDGTMRAVRFSCVVRMDYLSTGSNRFWNGKVSGGSICHVEVGMIDYPIKAPKFK